MAEANHGKGNSSLKRSRLRISIASDAATNLRGPLSLRGLNLEAVGPSCGLSMPLTGPLRPTGPFLKWRDWGLGPQSEPPGVLYILCKPGTRVKAAGRTKRGPSQNFRALFLYFSDPFSSGVGSLMLLGALKHGLGPQV